MMARLRSMDCVLMSIKMVLLIELLLIFLPVIKAKTSNGNLLQSQAALQKVKQNLKVFNPTNVLISKAHPQQMARNLRSSPATAEITKCGAGSSEHFLSLQQ